MQINNVSPNTIGKQQNKQNDNTSFKGKEQGIKDILKSEIKDTLTLKRQGIMSRGLLITNAFAFLLGTRLVTSRDKDERREILIRDVPSIVIAISGVPIISRFFGDKIQKKNGFGIMRTEQAPEKSDLRKWVENKLHIGKNESKLKPQNSYLSYGEIESLYKYDDNLASGISGFSKRLSNLGSSVDLKKIYSTLSDEIKNGIEKLNPKNNAELISKLESDKSLSQKIVEALKNPKNAAIKKATWLRTVPEMIGFGIALGLLGLVIPKTNIAITEKISKHRAAQNLNEKQDNKQPTKA